MRFEYFNLLQLQGSRAWFVTSEPKQTEAVFQICTTLFIATLLFGMFILFSRDVTSMVVRPIESMIDIVRKLAQNPTLKLEGQTKSKYETEAVRIALAKIVGLMQLGFGGAHPSPNPHPSPDPYPNPSPSPHPSPSPNPHPSPDPDLCSTASASASTFLAASRREPSSAICRSYAAASAAASRSDRSRATTYGGVG